MTFKAHHKESPMTASFYSIKSKAEMYTNAFLLDVKYTLHKLYLKHFKQKSFRLKVILMYLVIPSNVS